MKRPPGRALLIPPRIVTRVGRARRHHQAHPRGLSERSIERGAASYVLAGESLDDPVVGRLVARGLDDELKGTAYAVVDGADGRTHHIKLPDLDAAGGSARRSTFRRSSARLIAEVVKRTGERTRCSSFY